MFCSGANFLFLFTFHIAFVAIDDVGGVVHADQDELMANM